MMITTEIIISN